MVLEKAGSDNEMDFHELHDLLTKQLKLVPERLPSGRGFSYFFERVATAALTTRILRVHNRGSDVVEVKRSMSSLALDRDILMDLPLTADAVRDVVAEEILKYHERQPQAEDYPGQGGQDDSTTGRTVEQLNYSVSADVLHAIAILRERYGATHNRDSGHTKGRPTWIFELPAFGAEVGVPMNKRDLTLYMRNRTLNGQRLTDLLPPTKVAKVYPRDGDPASSVRNSKFLGAAAGNECVQLKLERSDLDNVFELFFGVPGLQSKVPHLPPPAVTSSPPSNPRSRAPMDAESFEALLERRSEVGQAGELLAVQDEIKRLEREGCPDPHRWVERVALSDVGRGYDIASTWPGHERYIEVKSTSSPESGLFVSRNERFVLAELGEKAWLYRVVLNGDGSGEITVRLKDPMHALPVTAFIPVVYTVSADELEPFALTAPTALESSPPSSH